MTRQKFNAVAQLFCFAIGVALLAIPLFYTWAMYDISTRDGMVYAAYAGDNRQIANLMLFGADPSAVGWEEHFTPLGGATVSGRVATVRYLLSRGADINRRDDHGDTALDIARKRGQTEIVSILEKAGSAN
jgi:ankyrin repeat protein